MKKLLIIIFLIIFNWLIADGTPPEGSGTEIDPYQMMSLDNLLWLSTTQTAWVSSSYFIQIQDIDATDTQNWNDGAGFSPIGLDINNPFSGNYSGNNHIIDGLYINRSGIDNLGLFGYTTEAFIEATGVTNVVFSGGAGVGGLVGWNNTSVISRCFTSGNVNGTSFNIGGLVGKNVASMISASYSTCNVSGNDSVGCLVGVNQSSTISDCFASGDVMGVSDGGGLVGLNFFSGTISDCYAIGSVSAETNAGGLVGWNYSGSIFSSIWNIETFPQNEGVGANYNGEISDLLGATTAEMQINTTYTAIGWDFAGEIVNGTQDIWNIYSIVNDEYPYISDLKWSLNELLANFSAVPVYGDIPMTVNFTDESISENIIITWEWDFENDGVIDSYEQNPSFVYNAAGIYSVTLTVTDNNNSTNTMIKEDYITVINGGVHPDGSGTEAEPYLVSALDNLLWISTHESSWSSYFVQTENIDASDTQNWNEGAGFSPIGTVNFPFSGYYNGGNHNIAGLYIYRPATDNVGFFGYNNGSNIQGLGIINANITGLDFAGSLAGYNENSTISECYTTGSLSGNSELGGLAGYNYGSTISECFAAVSVTGDTNVGGLAGQNAVSSIICDSYAAGNVIGGEFVGGLTGTNFNDSTINNCNATGSVQGTGWRIGSLVGTNVNWSTVSNCIWNLETSGQASAVGYNNVNGIISDVITATTAEMQIMSTYTAIGWDFSGETANGTEDIWEINSELNNSYPFISDLNWSLGEFLANFSGVPTSGYTPLTVNFMDESVPEDSIIAWQWDFDSDGMDDSEEQNPSFVYSEAGIYSVTLTVTDNNNSTNTMIKEDYITVIYGGVQPDGSGTEAEPYLVATLDNLLWLSAHESYWSEYFVQTADIDATATQNWNDGAGFILIGRINYPFSGNYHGSSHIIDGLYINRPATTNIGLFGYSSGAIIEGLGITNANITGLDHVGGLAGYSDNSTISECYATGSVSGQSYIGGLVGVNYNNSTISENYATCAVNGVEYIGGLVGFNNNNSAVSNNYATGNVSGNESVGGLAGYNSNFSSISKCYAIGSVSGNIEVGGLAGRNFNSSVISRCVWNTETSGQSTGIGNNSSNIYSLLGRTTAEMQMMSTYTNINWDFREETNNGVDDFWDIYSNFNNGYPYISDLLGSLYNGELLVTFSASTTYGSSPLAVAFLDGSVSENTIELWQWDFDNDGVIDSNEQNPVWIYNEPGVYTVRLTAANSTGRETSTRIKEDYITVTPDWQVNPEDFSYCGSIWGAVYLDYDLVDHTEGMLGCFVGDECRGVGSLEMGTIIDYTSEYGYIAFLPVVYSNVDEGEILRFKYWDSYENNGEIMNVWGSMEFIANMVIGNAIEPYEFLANPDIAIEQSLAEGWNWFSVNIDNEDMGIDNVLGSIGDNGENIKNQTQSAFYYAEIGWLGSLNDFNAKTMYMIKLSEADTLEFSGIPANIWQVEYNVYPGWNWISYSPQETENINYALSGLGEYATVIKGQANFSYYYEDAGWLGSLEELTPLSGYKLNANTECSFTYPLPENYSRESNETTQETFAEIEHREFDYNAYEFNGTLVFSCIDEIPEESIITAFCEDEVRGISELLDYRKQLDRKYFALMVYSDEPFEDGFRLYYQENEDAELVELDYGFTFESDMILGDFINPEMLILPQSDNDDIIEYIDKLSIYPNPFNPVANIQYELAESGNVSLKIYNLKGQKVVTLVNGYFEAGKHSISWDAENQSSGIYFIHYENSSINQVKKIALLK
ncbi:MAG: PKD domain-containing protein [Candidatus Cloacimonetes bacterium]|nr:PKD domain-containing protein [Candidatus Cloacimonadota bacterium]